MNKTSIPKLHSIKFKSGAFADEVIYPDKFWKGPRSDVPVINVLEGAAIANLRAVAIIGYEQDGTEYIASSMANPKEAAYLYARGHLDMLRRGD